MTVELPGMKAEEFDVEMKDKSLWITGRRRRRRKKKARIITESKGVTVSSDV